MPSQMKTDQYDVNYRDQAGVVLQSNVQYKDIVLTMSKALY